MSFMTSPITPHLVLGGSRSGKSAFAEKLVLSSPPPYIYVATAQVLDEEMRERVHLHRQRRTAAWTTIESPFALLHTLRTFQGSRSTVLVDCITLWLSNLLLQPHPAPYDAVDALCRFLGGVDYPLVLVSNEVGAGIVPDNPLARQFRDLAGAANQKIAAACNAVTLVVAGLPLALKPFTGTPESF